MLCGTYQDDGKSTAKKTKNREAERKTERSPIKKRKEINCTTVHHHRKNK
jgi:hypothetical protein